LNDIELQYNEMKDTQHTEDYDLAIDTFEVVQGVTQQYCQYNLE